MAATKNAAGAGKTTTTAQDATAAPSDGSASLAQALANSSEDAQRAAVGSSGLLPALEAEIAGTERALRVVARPPTFRRAGREFGPVAEVIPLRLLTEAEVAAIENEPELVCTRVFVPVEPSGDDGED